MRSWQTGTLALLVGLQVTSGQSTTSVEPELNRLLLITKARLRDQPAPARDIEIDP